MKNCHDLPFVMAFSQSAITDCNCNCIYIQKGVVQLTFAEQANIFDFFFLFLILPVVNGSYGFQKECVVKVLLDGIRTKFEMMP